MNYKHSGSLGDIIYSLPVIKKMGAGQLFIPPNELKNTCQKYGYNTSIMHKQHNGCMTMNDILQLKPLLEAQSYITKVSIGLPLEYVDLDKFRGYLFRRFHGNYVQAYLETFNLPFTYNDSADPWMEVDAKMIAPYVVCRTPRYITDEPLASKRHYEMARQYLFDKNAVFVGTEEEHKNYELAIDMKIDHYKVKDFLELAQVIAGCSRFIGNQTFAYSLAMALGRPAILEYSKTRPLNQNECYFRNHDVQYI